MTLRRAYFSFLEQLAEHDDRAWFKEREEAFRADVEGPFLALVGALAPGTRPRTSST